MIAWKPFTAAIMALLALGLYCQAVFAADGELDPIKKYGQEFKGKIAKSYEESKEWWPISPKPPAGTPNAIVFLLDDNGFAHQGSFGGLIDTPVRDRLADNGLRFNNFHTTALCSPSRAAIMAGHIHHRIGLGSHSLAAMGFPGDNAFAPESANSVAKHLQKAGFVNYALGKWDHTHTPLYEVSKSSPFDHWPCGEGFDHFYGFMSADADNYRSLLWRNHYPLEDWEPIQGYHLSKTMADEAIRNITSHISVSPDKPFMIFWAPVAMHSPHQAPHDYIDRDKGKFDMGWDKAREAIHKKQLEMGIVPKGINAKGEIRNQYHHIIDITPTILDVTGNAFLEVVDGEKQLPFDGVSMKYSFNKAKAPTEHPEQYDELFGNRAIYKDGWKAVTIHADRMPWNLNHVQPFDQDVWELYHIDEDFPESVNLAEQPPDKLEELNKKWEELDKITIRLTDWRSVTTIGSQPLRGLIGLSIFHKVKNCI